MCEVVGFLKLFNKHIVSDKHTTAHTLHGSRADIRDPGTFKSTERRSGRSNTRHTLSTNTLYTLCQSQNLALTVLYVPYSLDSAPETEKAILSSLTKMAQDEVDPEP